MANLISTLQHRKRLVILVYFSPFNAESVTAVISADFSKTRSFKYVVLELCLCLPCKATFSMTRCDKVHRIHILGIHNDDNRRQCCRAMSPSTMVHIQSRALSIDRHL